MTSENEARPGGDQGANEGGQAGQPAERDLSAQLARFFTAIHGENAPGVIEMRRIAEGGSTASVDRRWFATPAELIANFPALLDACAREGTGLFYGVLRRAAVGKGTSDDVLAGCVVWNDVDFKDFPGGETEARERLAKFPLPPSITVLSGHGLHPLWILREPCESKRLSALAKAIAQRTGGDHTHDRARLLRLPYSLNRKDPSHPIPVVIETFEPQRTYTASEIADALGLLDYDGSCCDDGPPPETAKPTPADASVLTSAISDAVRKLIASDKSIKDAFLGQGKCGKDANGRPFDTSGSGYDYTFAVRLVRAGITDRRELACAIANRMDGEAKSKGLDYIRRTVENVLERVKKDAAPKPEQKIDFCVDRVRAFDCTPKIFELTILGTVLRLTTSQLMSKGAFAHAFTDTFRRVPRLPGKGGGWIDQVNTWLANAEVVPMPDDASPELALREAVTKAIEGLPQGEEAPELDQNRAVPTGGGLLVFKLEALLHKLQPDWPRLNRTDLCVVLRDLGYEHATRSINGTKVRAWGKTETPSLAREGDSLDNVSQSQE